MKYKSIAHWPASAGLEGNKSEDTHDTAEQAEAVCRMLVAQGLGGEGKVFPITTEVEQINLHDQEWRAVGRTHEH